MIFFKLLTFYYIKHLFNKYKINIRFSDSTVFIERDSIHNIDITII